MTSTNFSLKPKISTNRDRQLNGEQSPMTNNQTVVVITKYGEVVGKTYPKRATGLVKKGRAEFLSEYVIRLKDFCPTEISEEINMDINNINETINNQPEVTPKTAFTADSAAAEQKNERRQDYILFNPRDYYKNPDLGWGTVSRHMKQLVDGSFIEVYSLGNWNNCFSGIVSKEIPISPDCDYTFVFWLNGGENDRNNEKCELLVIYTDGTHERATSEEYHGNYTYRLNRGNLKPVKTVDGWYLFAIDLPRTDKPYVEFRFEVNNAPTHLRAAQPPESYADIPDSPDEYAQYRKQRHNIFFEDGWPSESEYGGDVQSTAAIRKRLEALARGESLDTPKPEPSPEPTPVKTPEQSFMDRIAEFTARQLIEQGIAEQVAGQFDASDIADYVDCASDIADYIDMDEVAENIDVGEVAENIDIDEIIEHIDLDELAEKIAEKLDIRGMIEEMLEE